MLSTPPRQNRILVAVLFGSFVGNLEAIMPNAGLPHLVKTLHTSLSQGTWVLTIYILLFATSMPLLGKLGDRLGHSRLYVLSLSIFSVASVACALSPTILWLIVARALQGLSIAPALPSAMAIIAEHFDSESRGRAMGILGMVVAGSTALGAPLGGVLTHLMGWPAMFWVTAPLALIGVGVSLRTFSRLPERVGRKHPLQIDWGGATLFTAGVILLMMWLSTASTQGWVSQTSWVEGGGVVVVFWCYRWQSRRATVPFIPGTLWHHRRFRGISGVRALQMVVLYGVLFLLPIYWETTQHATPAAAGLGLLTLPLSMMVSAPWAGRASDRYGSRRIVALGMFLTAIGSVAIGGWPGNVANPLMIGSLIVLGIGFGFVQSASMTAVSFTLTAEIKGIALGIFNMLTFVGGTLGLALFGGLVSHSGGFRESFALMAVAGFFGMALAHRSIPDKEWAAAVESQTTNGSDNGSD